jgi:serine/threonine protein kinase
MHMNHVTHRDVKLENIRYNPVTQRAVLLDFGFSTLSSDDGLLMTNCGSPCYAPPEIYENVRYAGESVDVWSLGVCLYALLVGRLPFDGPSFRVLKHKVTTTRVSYPSSLSTDATELLQSIFVKCPVQRATIAQLQSHAFVKPYAGRKRDSSHKVIDADWVSQLETMDTTEAGRTLLSLLDLPLDTQTPCPKHSSQSSSVTQVQEESESIESQDISVVISNEQLQQETPVLPCDTVKNSRSSPMKRATMWQVLRGWKAKLQSWMF